jgi:hypothetical protein
MKKKICDKLASSLIKMQFEAVGAVYDRDSCTKSDWYREHAWTTAQKEAFKARFMKAIKRRYESATSREHLWGWWDLNYGWRDLDEKPASDTDD